MYAQLQVEQLESRNLLSVLTVLNANDSGADSLRDVLSLAQSGDVIHFAIPLPVPITLLSPLPAITQSLTINGFSQAGSQQNTSETTDNAVRLITIDGSLLNPGAVGFRVPADFVSIDGISFVNFDGSINGSPSSGANIILGGMNDTVVSCSFDGNGSGIVVAGSNNTFGSSALAGRNTVIHASAFGVFVVGENNTVEGNLIGTDGLSPLPNAEDGVKIEGNNNLITHNVISGNVADGVTISGGTGNTVDVNMIGTDATGMLAIPNTLGVNLAGTEDHNFVTNNVISSNNADGILISSSTSTMNVIQGNLIGTDPSGLFDMGNDRYGVDINFGSSGSSLNNIIGGPGEGEGNIIAFNDAGGVIIFDGNSNGNTIDPNSIYSNGGIGIDLQNGANAGVVSPVLQAIIPKGNVTMAAGFVQGLPNQSYMLEFFTNDSAVQEGKTFAGRFTVQTDAMGFVHFCFDVMTNAAGKFITATATDQNGNTSEFSLPMGPRSLVEAANLAPPQPPVFSPFAFTLAGKQEEQKHVTFSFSAPAAVTTEEEQTGSEDVSAISESECCVHSGGSDEVKEEKEDNLKQEQEVEIESE